MADDDLTGADMLALFGVLRRQFEKDKPGLEPTRQASIENVLDRLGRMVAEEATPGRSLGDLVADRGRIDGLIREVVPQGLRPSLKGPGPPSGSRSERLLAALQELKMFVFSSHVQPGSPPGVRALALDLFPRIARLTTWISEAGADAARVRHLERDQARGLAQEVRRFARLAHVMLARPIWGRYTGLADANRIFFSGPADTRVALASAAARLDLQMDDAGRAGADVARHRWEDLRAANVAVFDLAESRPQVYYELGIALATGMPLLLVAPEGTEIPFDVAQNVRFYVPSADPRRFLADELDAVLYSVPPQPGGSSVAPTRAFAERLATADGGNGLLGVTARGLREVETDPARFIDGLTTFIGFGGTHDLDVLLPAWPGAYPDPSSPRLFAVMPFRDEQEPAYAAVAAAARKAGLSPVRGDVAEGQQIIASIWEAICRATHVTIDLSGFNPNVCLEMGMAHALGRPTLLLGRHGTERQLASRLPGVAKWRCHTYGAGRPSAQFKTAVSRFCATR